ncbi:MAG: hypothetical protein HPY50_21370 [Firmicutes bacterium]|nr:hypothetical protein [Bacillota bacterium]
MVELNLLNLFLQGIPEAIAMVAVIFAINNFQFDWKKIILIAVLQGFTIYLVRKLPLTYGIHPPIVILSITIYILLFSKNSFIRILIPSCLTFLALAGMETIVTLPILSILGISVEEASKNNLLWILMGWPQIIGLSIIAFFINRSNRERKESYAIRR